MRERAAELGGRTLVLGPLSSTGPWCRMLPILDRLNRSPRSTEHPHTGGVMTSRDVVIADDHPMFRDGLRALLGDRCPVSQVDRGGHDRQAGRGAGRELRRTSC